MKKFVLAILVSLSSLSLSAQTTAVTATITDSDNTVWTNATVNVAFVPNPNVPNLNEYTIAGVPITQTTGPNYAQYIQQKVISDPITGLISVTLLDNNLISPGGSTWRF